uniref:Interleukin 7 receptor n=1 Tax=Ginglymostoma cirratum TaxID=7801 RepID=V9NJB8_GINCI|nr:interleukin 7 receptor [Ginglymostoma cirratum]
MLGHETFNTYLYLTIILKLLQDLPHLLAQSGSYDNDDEPDLPRITCFSKLTNQAANDRITCKLTEPIIEGETLNITFSEDRMTESCQIKLRETRSCSVEASRFTLFKQCCIRVSRSESLERGPCVFNKKIIHMVKPECPIRLGVNVLTRAREIELQWDSPPLRFTLLRDKLLHQVSYCSSKPAWENINVTGCSVRLLMKNLIPSSEYMIRVRSIPDQGYFKGIWSDWSETVTFQTPKSAYRLSAGIKLTMSSVTLLLIIVIGLGVLCWENRIKPHIWPKIPNPKSTLEHLYMKPNKTVAVSFNPSSFLDVMESRVDTIQVRGSRRSCRAPSSGSEAADCNNMAPERELLMGERATRDISGTSWHKAKCPAQEGADSPQCLRLVRGDPEDDRLPGSPHGHAPGPGGQNTAMSPTSGHSHNGGAAYGGQGFNVQGTGESCPHQVDQGSDLGSTLAADCPLTPSDQSYITMSNLYQIQ